MAKRSPTPALDALIQAEPDLVDRIFEYLLRQFPQVVGLHAEGVREAVRDEFRGEKVWIAKRPASERRRLAHQVLQLFNGRNATEVARELKIGRATVYRILKQSGYETSLTFSVSGTPEAVASSRLIVPTTQKVDPCPPPTTPNQTSRPSGPPSPAASSPS